LQVHKTTFIHQQRKRQGDAKMHGRQQLQEIGFDTFSINQGRADNDDLQSGSLFNLTQNLLGLPF